MHGKYTTLEDIFLPLQVCSHLILSLVLLPPLTLVLTYPEIFSISPRSAEISELFPEPTTPTTATSAPFLTLTSVSYTHLDVYKRQRLHRRTQHNKIHSNQKRLQP